MKNHLSDSELGKETVYPRSYDASLLFPIDRKENRDRYQINTNSLPFTGWDVWNAYEVSFLTDNYLPVSGILKIRYSAENKTIVESKSLKLYLNSFNLEAMGATPEIAGERFLKTVKTDLETLLETEVFLSFFSQSNKILYPFDHFGFPLLTSLVEKEKFHQLKFTAFHEAPELLRGKLQDKTNIYTFQSDLLRSNCPVTNQPDWGDIFCYMESTIEPDWSSVIAYLVSFRKENHFHEEVAEMIFKRFLDIFKPGKLMIATMYTRRGGIDINPIRATHVELIDPAFTDVNHLLGKTSRQ